MTLTFRLDRAHLLACIGLALLAGCAGTPEQGGVSASPEPKAANELAEVQTKLGIGYLRAGKLDLAYDRLTKALQADPNFSTAHNAMGTLQERLGDTASAEQHFRKAVALNPMDSYAQNNFGGFLCRTSHYEEAEQHFRQALNNSLYLRPDVAYSNAGLCMMAAGNLAKAETYFRSALERNPRMPAALEGMAEISFEQQRYLPARAYLQRYAEVGEMRAKGLWLGVRVERALGDEAAADLYAAKLRNTYPDSHETGELEASR